MVPKDPYKFDSVKSAQDFSKNNFSHMATIYVFLDAEDTIHVSQFVHPMMEGDNILFQGSVSDFLNYSK